MLYRHHKEYALVVFGFPPRLAKPFGSIFGDSVDGSDRNSHRKHDFGSDALDYGLQRYAELEQDGFRNPESSFYSRYFNIYFSLNTVLYAGMVFTELNISIVLH
jgi:hypothetical protein